MALPGIRLREVNKGSFTIARIIPGELVQSYEVSVLLRFLCQALF
jgi:hypothetical protein